MWYAPLLCGESRCVSAAEEQYHRNRKPPSAHFELNAESEPPRWRADHLAVRREPVPFIKERQTERDDNATGGLSLKYSTVWKSLSTAVRSFHIDAYCPGERIHRKSVI